MDSDQAKCRSESGSKIVQRLSADDTSRQSCLIHLSEFTLCTRSLTISHKYIMKSYTVRRCVIRPRKIFVLYSVLFSVTVM